MLKEDSYLKIQSEMVESLKILDENARINLIAGSTVVTVDVQYKNEWGFVAMDCLSWESEENQLYLTRELVEAEYVPGFFAFREGPIIQKSIEALISQKKITPALLILDGHGTAHPRKIGLASWVGIKMGISSIGVAKESLLKKHYKLNDEAGAVYEIIESGQIIGTVLRTQAGTKPVFVSAGHLISQRESVEIVKKLSGKYRIIEPMRRADQAARRYAKGEIIEESIPTLLIQSDLRKL